MTEASESRDLLLNQLADEFATRRRRGERPHLEAYCERYPELADEIRSLFPAMVELEKAKADAGPELAVHESDAPPVTQLGDFHLLREVGRGGMGVVYEAEQVSLGRRVALKLLPAEVFRDPIKKRRFEREAKAAARLHHTNIVPVHGFGEHAGTPYYVMQFIPGLGLDAVIDELSRLPFDGRSVSAPRPAGARADLSAALARSLVGADVNGSKDGRRRVNDVQSLTAAADRTPDPTSTPRVDHSSAVSFSATGLALPGQSGSGVSGSGGRKATYWQSVARIGVQVSGALAYAHKQGILHRDIKPGNLLLDLDGVVWVTDFGLAKGDDSDNLTHTGDLLGTLRYMPPEAFEGKSDARGDVYSLGLTLFELIALRPAYDESDRNKLIKRLTTGDAPPLRKLRTDAPRDLVTIVEKAGERDPARRYQSASAMADDLQRFLDGRPITARRATEVEKLWMWARRRPAVAGLVAALFLCLLGGAVTSAVFAVRADGFAREAVAREKDATIARDAARRNADEATTTRNAAARQAAGLLFDKAIEDARSNEPARALHLFVQALKALPAGDSRSAALERMIRMNLSAWAETVPALEHILPDEPNNRLYGFGERTALSPDGSTMALNIGDDEVQCLRTGDGRPAGPPAKLAGWVGRVLFAPDGRSVWVESTNRPRSDADGWLIHRIDPVTGCRTQPPIVTTGPLFWLLATPDGRHLVGAVNGLDPKDTGPRADATLGRLWRTAAVVVWDTASGEVVRRVEVNGARNYCYIGLSSDAKAVTTWVPQEPDRLEGLRFSVTGNEPPEHLGPHPARFHDNPDGGWSENIHFQSGMESAMVVKDGQVHRWSASDPATLGPGAPTPFLFMRRGPAPDGRSVISKKDGRVFDTGAWPPRPGGVKFSHPALLDGYGLAHGTMQYGPDGGWLATGIGTPGFDRRCWRLPRPHSRPALPPTEFARLPIQLGWWTTAMRFDPRMSRAVHLSAGPHEVRVLDLATGGQHGTALRHADFIRDVAWDARGDYFATGSSDNTARVWEAATGRPAGPPLRHNNHVAAVAFSPDGRTLAAGDFGPAGLVKLWDWRTGTEVRPPLVHDDIVQAVAFSPDGRYLAVIKLSDWSVKPELLIWDVDSGAAILREPHNVADHGTAIRLVFRPDGRALAARDGKGRLTLWSVPGGQRLGSCQLDGHGATRFSPDGRTVAAAERNGVRLFDAETLAPLPGGHLPHPDAVSDVAFSPDGAFLVTGRREGSAQLWDVATRKPIGPPAVLIGAILAVGFAADGKTCVCAGNDGTVRRWPVPAPLAEPDLARLADRVALMTALRMDENQGLSPVPGDEWRELRARLASDGSTALVRSRPDADWHDARAADAEQDHDVFGTEWHLDRLAKSRPNDWTIPARRGRVLAIAGRRDEADTAYAAARQLAPSPRVLADWLRVATGVDEAAGRADVARWNLDRAVALTQGDWTLYAARALLSYKSGNGDRAAADVDEMIRRGADDAGTAVQVAERAGGSGDWKRAAAVLAGAAARTKFSTEQDFHWAVACLKAGDTPAFRAICDRVAGRLPPVGPGLSRADARRAAALFALHADATENWNRPLTWIDHALTSAVVSQQPTASLQELFRQIRHSVLHVRGALLYRAGRYEEAVQVLRDGMGLHFNGGDFGDWCFLALAEHRLGHAGAATAAAIKARAAAKPGTVWERAEFDILCAELDSVLPPVGQ